MRLTLRFRSSLEGELLLQRSVDQRHQPNAAHRSFDRCREYGLHAIDLQRLSGEIADVRVKKLKSRLVVALVKAGRRRGSYGKQAAWTNLQAPLEKPAD